LLEYISINNILLIVFFTRCYVDQHIYLSEFVEL